MITGVTEGLSSTLSNCLREVEGSNIYLFRGPGLKILADPNF